MTTGVKGSESCLSRTGAVFCGGKNRGCDRISKPVGTAEFRDKVVKLARAALGLTKGILTEQYGSDHIQTQRVSKAESAMGTARDVFGLMNIFSGVLPGMVKSVRNIRVLSRQLSTGESVAIGSGVLNKADGQREKALAIGELFGKLVGGASYAWGFGVARVIKFTATVGVPLSQGAKAVKDSFYLAMFISHIGAIFSNIAAWTRKALAYSRALSTDPVRFSSEAPVGRVFKGPNDTPQPYSIRFRADLERQFVKESCHHAISLVEKGLEIVMDAHKVLNAKIPPLAMGIIGTGAALCGCARLFISSGYQSPDPLAG